MRKSGIITYSIVALLLIGTGYLGFLLFHDMTPPTVLVSPAHTYVSPSREITVTATDTASSIKGITVVVHSKGRILPVLEKRFTEDAPEQKTVFTLKETGLSEGEFDLEITVSDNSFAWFGRGNSVTHKFSMIIDTIPPRISQKTSQAIVRRGGAGCVLFSVSKEVEKVGVEANGLFYPAHRQSNGDFLCFFAFPYYLAPADFSPQILAIDKAGNKRTIPVDIYRIDRQFKQDTLNISDSFLNSKAVEFASIVPGEMPEIERFLKVNGPVRKACAETLFEIARDTSPEMLWAGIFLRLPKAASRAGFADHRTYMWQGNKVDEQTHLGYDFASTAQAEIPAANSGRVVYSGYLGIYGNLVIIDHGVGVHSLYSHMSSINVEKGQQLNKGDIVGRTGKTGMAGGDHLHFGMLVGGLEVTPLEWLDPKWINDNITNRLKEAGLPVVKR